MKKPPKTKVYCKDCFYARSTAFPKGAIFCVRDEYVKCGALDPDEYQKYSCKYGRKKEVEI